VSNKPSNWYQMSCEERRAWDRAERQRQDLEYERERALEDAERAERYALQRERQLSAMISENESRLGDANDALASANAELALYEQWVKEKGLAGEFDDWASYRRTE